MKRLLTLVLVLFVCVMFASCQSLCSHEFESAISVAPQCEADGERTNTCVKCGYAETETVSKTGHAFDNGTVTQEPACGVEGVLTYGCENCHATKTEVIPALEHSYDEGAVTRDATCAEEGELTYTCTLCGGTKAEAIEILPHTLGEDTVVKEATCAEEGQIAKLCAFCDYAEVVGQIPKTEDHVFEEQEVRAPTCIDKGEGKKVCTVCEYSESFEYDYTDHTYDAPEVLLYPTCTEYGQQQYDCIHCDHSYTEDLYPYGHAYGSGVTTKAASCWEEGTLEYTCTECGAIYVEAIPFSDHTWSAGSCYDPAVCEVCGYVDYYSTGHNYVFDYDNPPSQYYAGRTIYVCTNCDERYVEYYGQNGNIYDLETIEWYIYDYAVSKGFKTESIESPTNMCLRKYNIGYNFAERDGGQNYLIQSGYVRVDWVCEELAGLGVDPTQCTISVSVSVNENSTYGMYFTAYVAAYY